MPIDYKRYPPNWKTYIVPTVIARAGNCCEDCGLKNKSTVYSIKLWVRDGIRYKLRTIWFRDLDDACRESEEGRDDVKNVKVVLTIAHLDHDEENNNVKLDRLKALCQICHLRYDAKEKLPCDNPKCVNPDHLFLGTNKDNVTDRNRKNRTAITDEAEKYAFRVPYDGSNKFYNDDRYEGYIAGATAERLRGLEREAVLASRNEQLREGIRQALNRIGLQFEVKQILQDALKANINVSSRIAELEREIAELKTKKRAYPKSGDPIDC